MSVTFGSVRNGDGYSVKCKVDRATINAMGHKFDEALRTTIKDVYADVKDMEIIPYKTGRLQNRVRYYYGNKVVSVTNTQPYSEYIYKGISKKGFMLNYNRSINRFAGSHWFEVAGEQKGFEKLVEEHFKEECRKAGL